MIYFNDIKQFASDFDCSIEIAHALLCIFSDAAEFVFNDATDDQIDAVCQLAIKLAKENGEEVGEYLHWGLNKIEII